MVVGVGADEAIAANLKSYVSTRFTQWTGNGKCVSHGFPAALSTK